jgi:hypothetical protein
MRGHRDAEIERRSKQKTPPGGKALQRLFAYLRRRDPAMRESVAAALVLPGAGQTARKPRPRAAAKSFAAALSKAAAGLSKGRGRARRAATRGVAGPPSAAPPWHPLGPSVIPNGQTYGSNLINVIGRVACIAIDPKNPQHVLLGAAGGGIWESKNAGAAWSPCTDNMPSLAIGAIAFDPGNAARVYAGSGEGNFYYNLGAGVYQSTNGGTNWSVLAAAPFLGAGFYDLVVDPHNPQILYAATTQGFFKSVNSGGSWKQTRNAVCWDISVHPGGGTVELLAAFADGLFVSTNGGSSFTPVALPGKPAGAWTRLAVDRVTASPDVAYVFGAAGSRAFLWRRTGTAWASVTPPGSPSPMNLQQAWYDWYVACPPDNTQRVFLGAIDGFRGDLAGKVWKWTDITTQGPDSIHPDQHCLTFSPGNSNIIYAGSDGGIFRSANSGASWTALNSGLGITEMEYIAGDPTTPKWLMAGTQDNGTIGFTGTSVWKQIAQGDGGDCGVNQLNPSVIYHSYYGVSLERSVNKGGSWSPMNPPSLASLFYPPVEVFGGTVAIGAASLLVTRNGIPPWTTVPLGLTGNEVPSAMRDIDANNILVGTTTGRMLRLSWTGSAWSKTQLASPASRYISCIAVDPSNPQRFWVTISQVGGPSVYRSDNAGTSWINCSAALPKIPMNAVAVDPANYKRVWVAADVGVYETLNLGGSWAVFGSGLPNAMAADLLFHKQARVLFCATRNRGAWAIAVP